MKKNIILYTCLFFMVTSCNKFGDTNIDPNNSTTVETGFLLTNVEKSFVDFTNDVWAGGRTTYLNAQYWAQNNYTEDSRYAPRPAISEGIFATGYAYALINLEEIIEINKTNNDKGVAANQTAIARILKVWRLHYMTDLWGSIPYSEALKGSENRTPKYDTQKEVYFGLLKELKEATAQIEENSPSFASGDIIYQGDMSKWKKLAASLSLRIAMRMSDVEGATAQAIVEQVANANIAFSAIEDNAYFTYLNGQPNNNPLNMDRIQRGDDDFCLSNILIDNTLVPLNDPRLAVFADKSIATGKYKGRPYGQSSDVAAAEASVEYSQPSGAFAVTNGGVFNEYDVLAPTAKAAFMRYSEVCFILAEAKERGWKVSGTAEEWYDKAITASMNEWGITDAIVISNYLKQKDVAYTTAKGDWKQKIGVQKWISLYLEDQQGWAEWRRLDFEKLILPVSGALSDIGTKNAPMRIVYPNDEQTKNSVNYNDAVQQIGGSDDLKTRLWWDVK